MIRIVTRFSSETIAALDLARKSTRIPRAALIRRAVEAAHPAPVREPPQSCEQEPTSCASPAEACTLPKAPPLRPRILAKIEEAPHEIHTAPRLAQVLAANSASVRNGLLDLAKRGLIVKVAEGQYRARPAHAGSMAEGAAA